MNKTTSTIIFIVIAIIAIIGITFALNSTPSESPSPSTSVGTTTDNTTPATSTPVTTEKTYTLADIAKHAVKADCWTTIKGNVYDLTSFIPNHPGGDRILVVCGKDGTLIFQNQHDSQKDPNAELAKHKIGVLVK